MSLLSIDRLIVNYGAINAVCGVSLEVSRGEVVALLGANGAGKTTTLSAVTGLIPSSGGSVMFDGAHCRGVSTERLVRAGMTMVPEGRRIFATLTVDENLTLGGAIHGTDRREALRREMFALFPILHERMQQWAGTLSGGQQQQLAIARSLMSDPKLLIMDEPSLGLAPQIVAEIFELIARLRRDGRTILLVEQNVAKALEIADRGYVLVNGRIAFHGTAAELLASKEIEHAYLGREAEQ